MSHEMQDGYRSLLDASLMEQRDLPSWAEDLRRQALGRFEAVGFPGRKDEDWKYTRVGDLARGVLTPLEPGAADVREAVEAVRVPGAHLLVLVDGRLRPELGDGAEALEGLPVRSLGAALREEGEALSALLAGDATAENAFGALAAAFAVDGVVLRVGAGRKLERPLQVVHVSTGATVEGLRMIPTRFLVELGREAQATVVECFVGDAGPMGVVNHATRIRVGDGATLHHIRLQAEGVEARHFSNVEVDVQRDASYRSLVLSTGARVGREDLRVSLNQPGGHADLAALSLAGGTRHLDHNTLIDHRVPHCTSDQLYKNVLGGRGRTVFHGKIHVHPDAQKTEAFQLNQSLLLSEEARTDTRPQLEIFADDVKCSHGATIGRLQDEALFYLQSRAIGPEVAGLMLVRGFALDVLARVEDGVLGPWLTERLDRALEDLL